MHGFFRYSMRLEQAAGSSSSVLQAADYASCCQTPWSLTPVCAIPIHCPHSAVQCLRVSVLEKVQPAVFAAAGVPGANLLYGEVLGIKDTTKAELAANDVIERLLQLFKDQVGRSSRHSTAGHSIAVHSRVQRAQRPPVQDSTYSMQAWQQQQPLLLAGVAVPAVANAAMHRSQMLACFLAGRAGRQCGSQTHA